jgi:ATP-dependent DNA helicase RecG
MAQFKAGKTIARHYRNRRIGECLKAIGLSRSKSTGITRILQALKKNNSPLPDFETDDDRNYLITTIKVNQAFVPSNPSEYVEHERSLREVLSAVEIGKMAPIIRHLQEHGSITPREAMEATGKSAATTRRYLAVLCDKGVLSAKGKTNTIRYWLSKVNWLS